MAMTPTITMMIEMTIATMGRWMKNRAIDLRMGAGGFRRGCFERCGSHGHACLHALQPFDDDALAGLKPLVDHPLTADPLADLDLSDLDLVVLVHDGRLVIPLQLRHRALRNQQGALSGFRHRPYAREQSRAEHVARIRKQGADADGAGL